MISVQFHESIAELPQKDEIHPAVLEDAALRTLQYCTAPAGAEATIVIGDDGLLHQLNLRFRGIDAPTDVLSFSGEYTDPDTQTPYLGDILISLTRAQEQAAAGGHSLHDEIVLLVVHGMLHLLGHDHAEEGEKSRMQTAQTAILTELGYGEITTL